ncbi:hypothetical protein [Dictyobacter arantiisoli]|uniref:Uncharacterized protein n=1 Tax=Dictyobacter arantiisoli TaxID=2014874 RepID=A0A5A5TG29_9CHLR|nr:hypothetical protein [Dictyobacter arantiisoli]GCF10023.1 hypothetical protein KDI_35870 [Dictyobacter arantiisoli]
MPLPSESDFQIDTVSVQDLGTGIVNGAKSVQSSPDPEALDTFKSDIDKVVPEMPLILQGKLAQFNTNFYKAYTDVLTQRSDIGRILLNTATAADKQEVSAVNVFTDIAPTTLIS